MNARNVTDSVDVAYAIEDMLDELEDNDADMSRVSDELQAWANEAEKRFEAKPLSDGESKEEV